MTVLSRHSQPQNSSEENLDTATKEATFISLKSLSCLVANPVSVSENLDGIKYVMVVKAYDPGLGALGQSG